MLHAPAKTLATRATVEFRSIEHGWRSIAPAMDRAVGKAERLPQPRSLGQWRVENSNFSVVQRSRWPWRPELPSTAAQKPAPGRAALLLVGTPSSRFLNAFPDCNSATSRYLVEHGRGLVMGAAVRRNLEMRSRMTATAQYLQQAMPRCAKRPLKVLARPMLGQHLQAARATWLRGSRISAARQGASRWRRTRRLPADAIERRSGRRRATTGRSRREAHAVLS